MSSDAKKKKKPSGPGAAAMDVQSSSPAQQQRRSRKHLRSSGDDDNLTWSSDVSGRFDDADEGELTEDNNNKGPPSARSVKRRRSNDWPLPVDGAEYGHQERRQTRHGFGGSALMRGMSFRSSPRASPRASLASLLAKHHQDGTSASSASSPHQRSARRSRFVEASMGDSVSERPPSIFTRDSKLAGHAHRQSGIFRFGKAIASAFNPFGGWGKSSPEGSSKSPPQKDALSQAEQAYAELKKAGYQGTNKNVYYPCGHQVDSVSADQTWQSLHEKIDHGSAMGDTGRLSGDQGTRTTPSRSDSRSSKRSSFQDLRKGFPFIKQHEGPPTTARTSLDRTSEDSENGGLRKQRSRRELSRQAKLLKKVSNLEEKLDRARGELRELAGKEESMPAPAPQQQPQPSTLCMEMDPGGYPRKFVPGALPTLPSERLLDQQAAESALAESAGLTALPSMQDDRGGKGDVSPLEEEDTRPAPSATAAAGIKSPKGRSKADSQPSLMGKDRSSRKRKSPVPESLASRKSPQPRPTHGILVDHPSLEEEGEEEGEDEGCEHLADLAPLSPLPRKAKWQKFEAGDSPGSVERKKRGITSKSTQEVEGRERGVMMTRKWSSFVQPRRFTPYRPPRSPTSSPSKSTGPQTPARMRHMSPAGGDSAALVPDSDAASDNYFSPSPQTPATDSRRAFYLQQHRQLDPDRSPSRLLSPSPASVRSSPTRSRSYFRANNGGDDDIPPVPPLPTELLKNAAQVTKSPNNKTSVSSAPRDHTAAALEPQTSSVLNRHQPQPTQQQLQTVVEYPWPEDIF